MTFDQWLAENGKPIKDRWNEWCLYYVKYRHHYAADFRIPVPKFYFDAMAQQDPQRAEKVLAYFRQQFAAGTPAQMPPPVPAPPAATFAGRAMQHGQASQTTGEAMRRGAMEGFKSQAPKAARTILGLLFKR